MSTQHTPGPWSTDEKDHESPHQDIEVVSGKRGICRIWLDDAPVRDYNAEQRANAALITAAPELLAALQKFIDYEKAMDSGDDVSAMLIYAEFSSVARAAIAKAS